MDTKLSTARLRWDLSQVPSHAQYERYYENRKPDFIPRSIFENHSKIFLEIGAGSGCFVMEMARLHADTYHIAVERDKERGKTLVRRTERSGLPNLSGYRGNAIPALIHGVPSESLDRIYILYPCPWPKTAHRKHRWFLHPVMPHLIRVLKPGGLLIWTSDQEFYIQEAAYVCANAYKMETLSNGKIQPNPWNELARFPEGRTKFERTFWQSGMPSFEYIGKKISGSIPGQGENPPLT